MILSFFSVKIIPAAYAAHDCKLYISHLPISIWNEDPYGMRYALNAAKKNGRSRIFSPAPPSESLFPILPLFQRNPENKCIHTSDQEVTSCVTEKVVWNTAIFASIGAGRRFGIRISEITIPMNSAFTTDPAAMPAISPPFPLHFFRDQSHTQDQKGIARHDTRHDRRNGTDDRASVIKNDVTGVITERIMPQGIPTLNTAKIRHALMTGPVI